MGTDQVPDGQGFGELLLGFRQAAGLSQEELADRSGLSARAISNLERGRTTHPHPRTVRSLADALALGAAAQEQLDRASRQVVIDADTAGRGQPGSRRAGRRRGRALSRSSSRRRCPASRPGCASWTR